MQLKQLEMAMQAKAVARAERTQNEEPKLDRPIVKQSTFEWSSTVKYAELKELQIGD